MAATTGMAPTAERPAYIERGNRKSIDWISMRDILDPEIPDADIRRYAFSEMVVVRRAAAYNPAVPKDVLEALAMDADESVRLAAEMGLKARGLRRGA